MYQQIVLHYSKLNDYELNLVLFISKAYTIKLIQQRSFQKRSYAIYLPHWMCPWYSMFLTVFQKIPSQKK